MPVATTTRKKQYDCNGSQVTFPITFAVTLDSSGDAENIAVKLTDSSGTVTPLTETTDYTISGQNVVTVSTYASGNTLTIYRDTPTTRETDFEEGDTSQADTFDANFDTLHFLIQEISEELGRSVQLDIGDETSTLTLPTKASRASTILGFDADGEPIASEGITAPVTTFMKTVLDDTDADTAQTTLGIKTLYQEQAEDKKELGELFWMDSYQDPVEWSWANRRTFFPAICLDTISTYTDISSTNWSDLVTHLRAKTFTYLDGTGSEDSSFDVTGWDITSNVATLTFANTTAENAILAALLEDKLVHGSYTNWRSITLASAIGDITAGEYAITEVDTASRTVKFAFTAADNSGSGTFTVNFYQHRVPGSTTTARLFETKGRTLVSGNDSDGDCIIGMRRRDRFQGHKHTVNYKNADGVLGTSLAAGADNDGQTSVPFTATYASDGTNGTPRTGKTTDPRALIGHLFMWGRSYSS